MRRPAALAWLLRGRNARVSAGVAGATAFAVVIAIAPGLGVTNASWTDQEWTTGTLGAQALTCGTDQRFTTTASGRFLGGSLLGTDLDAVAGLAPVDATRAGSAAPAATPSGATRVNTDATDDTYLNPLDISALGGGLTIDLSGLNTGLPVGSAGAVNQYARVTDTGYSAGAAGLVTDSGGVGVTPATPSTDLPDPATIGISTLLPAIANVTDVNVGVGAVASSSTLDWCGQLQSALWGDGSVNGSTRTYGIAGLDANVASPLVGTLVTDVNTTVTDLQSAVNALAGTNGALATAIQNNLVGQLLGILNLGTLTGNVSITGLDLTTVTNMLTGEITDPDGLLTVDLSTGVVRVSLAKLLGGPDGLNDMPPNHELVIDPGAVMKLTTALSSDITAWVTGVSTALTNAIAAATVNVNLSTSLILPDVPLVGDVPVASVGISGTVGLGALRDGTATLGVTLTQDPSVTGGLLTAVNLLLSTLTLGALNLTTLLSNILGALNGTGILSGVAALVTTNLVTNVVTPLLGTVVTGVINPLVTALGALLPDLSGVLSIMVNVQPDQPGAPPGSAFTAAVPPLSSAQYEVTALRLGVLDALGGAFTFVELATSSAGVNSYAP